MHSADIFSSIILGEHATIAWVLSKLLRPKLPVLSIEEGERVSKQYSPPPF